MKALFSFICICCTSYICYSQSLQFAQGFQDGYKIGYCHDKDYGCVPPIPPVSPIPSVNESSTSYFDGYNRGFSQAKRFSSDSHIDKEKSAYSGSNYFPDYKPFIPDYTSFNYYMTRKNGETINDGKTITKEQAIKLIWENITRENKIYNSIENKGNREKYASLIRGYYKSFKTYPNTPIPDGRHSVYLITNIGDFGYEVHSGDAYTKNNKIFHIMYNHCKTPEETDHHFVKNTEWDLENPNRSMDGSITSYLIANTHVHKGKSNPSNIVICLGEAVILENPIEVYFIHALEEYNK